MKITLRQMKVNVTADFEPENDRDVRDLAIARLVGGNKPLEVVEALGRMGYAEISRTSRLNRIIVTCSPWAALITSTSLLSALQDTFDLVR